MMRDWFLLRSALRDSLYPRRLLITALLVALPAIVALVMRALAPADSFHPIDIYSQIVNRMVFLFILTLLSVVHGTGALSREIEGRTIVYLLTRPMPRWRILLAKAISAWIVVSVTAGLASVFLALSLFGFHMGPYLLRDLVILSVGAAAYTALFVLLSALLTRQLFALLLALFFAVGWENLISRLPGGFARLSVMAHLQVLAPHLKDAVEEGADATSQLLTFDPAVITTFQAWLAMSLTLVIALGLALIVFSYREYSPREEGG